MARGRKARYTQRVALRICEHIALGDTVQKALAKEPLAPAMSTFWKWLDEHQEFREWYERARRIQADLRVDHLSEMAAQVIKKPKLASAFKVATDIYRWQAEVTNPKKYGKQPEVSVTLNLPDASALRDEINRLEKELGVIQAEVKEVPALSAPDSET